MWFHYRRTLISAVGFLLVAGGLAVAFWWHYLLGPMRRTLDPAWVTSHSSQDYWYEVQAGIRRGTWEHDDGFTVGYYGDESWARWIMARVKPGDDMGCAYSLNHSAFSMKYITNQNAGEVADGWLAWWRANQDKTQRQWIADGFRQRGLNVDYPLHPAQTEALLGLLGKPPATGDEFLKYNSFRWLRDSEFNPVEFALSQNQLSHAVKCGLREYAKLEANFPRAGRLGNLALALTDNSSVSAFGPPAIVTRRSQITFGAMIWMPIVLGVALMCWSLRKAAKPKATEAASATTTAAG